MSEIGHEADVRDSILTVHTCFLVKSLSQREDHIRDIAENLLTQVRDRFPQVNFKHCMRNLSKCALCFLFFSSPAYLRLELHLCRFYGIRPA